MVEFRKCSSVAIVCLVSFKACTREPGPVSSRTEQVLVNILPPLQLETWFSNSLWITLNRSRIVNNCLLSSDDGVAEGKANKALLF